MDERIEKIIEVCRYEQDPSWSLIEQLFHRVSFKNLQRVLERRDMVVRKLILSRRKGYLSLSFKISEPVVDFRQLRSYAHETEEGIKFMLPMLFKGGLRLPDQRLFISKSEVGVFIDSDVALRDVVIDAPTYISSGVLIKYSKIQDPKRCNYIGEDVIISNVSEMCGCFISGGKFNHVYVGRDKTYMHAASINNMIIGAGTGISGGTQVHNHPQGNTPSAIHDFTEMIPDKPRTYIYPQDSEHFKMPIFIGVGASIGLNCSIHSGSIVGGHCIVPGNSIIEGSVIMKNGRPDFTEFKR